MRPNIEIIQVMNTKLLMTTSALVMGIAGIALTFAPDDILGLFNPHDQSVLDKLVLQIIGALYFAFAMVNWTARANLIGGIYGRPIAIGNFTHFVVGALALMKGYASVDINIILLPAIFYVAFAVLFGIVFFTHPMKSESV
jgi:Na+-driven multidrug efflux pump